MVYILGRRTMSRVLIRQVPTGQQKARSSSWGPDSRVYDDGRVASSPIEEENEGKENPKWTKGII